MVPHTFHLTFARDGADTSAGRFVATLWDERRPESAHRTMVVPEALRALAKEMSKGAGGKPDNTAMSGAPDAMRALLQHGLAESDRFGALANVFLNTNGTRLAVHVSPNLLPTDRELLENLPWSSLENFADGRLRVVRHAPQVDFADGQIPSFRTKRRTSQAQVDKTLRVLVVIGSIDQPDGETTRQHADAAEPHVTALLRALRDNAAKVRGLELLIVAPRRVLELVQVPGLDAHELELRDHLRQILRGERAVGGLAGFDVVWFVGHSDAVYTERYGHVAHVTEATKLLCGFQAAGPDLTKHPSADCLTAEDLADDLKASGAADRTVLVVIDSCKVGGSFVRPLLATIDHAIGTLGLVSPEVGVAWAPVFLRELAALGSVGDSLLAARKAIRDCGNANVHNLWWQLTHWTATHIDQPFGTADGLALLEYGADLRRKLFNLEGDFATFSLRDAVIPLAIERVTKGEPPNEPRSEEEPGWNPQSGDALELANIVKKGGTWFLFGEPGGGKTTSLRSEAMARIEALEQLDPDEIAAPTSMAIIPVYVKLPEWLVWSRNTATLSDLLTFAVREVHKPHAERLVELLRQRRRRLVLLLDGWDEIDPKQASHLEAAERLVKALVGKDEERVHAVAIACRFAARPQPPLPGTNELRVLRLDRERQTSLLANFLGGNVETTQRVLMAIDAQPGSLQQLVTIPLYLALLGQMAAKKSDDGLKELLGRVRQRHLFMADAVTFLLANKHRTKRRDEGATEDELRRQIAPLAALAFSVLCGGDLEPCREMIEEKLRELNHDHPGSLFDAFARSSILRPVNRSEPKGRWTFQHRSFIEAMAARHLSAVEEPKQDRARLHEERKKEAVAAYHAKAGKENEKDTDRAKFWAEPFALAAGHLCEGAKEWIEWLLSNQDLKWIGLAAVAIADSDHMPATLIHDVLWKNRNLPWQEKVPLYESLVPPLGRAGKPEVRKQLLRYVEHELKGHKRWHIQRAELWWIDWVFERVAKDESTDTATRQEVEAERDKLMRLVGARKIPAKIVKMLTVLPKSIEEGKHRDTYWRYVPKGHCKIGTEEYHDKDLRLRLRVRDPFWMAEIHVTKALWRLFTEEATTCAVRDARRSQKRRGPGWQEVTAFAHWCMSYEVYPAAPHNWYEATAFARWLTVHLHPLFGQNLEIRLPSEWEWEYCATFLRSLTSGELEGIETPPFGWAETPSGPVAVTDENLDAKFGEKRKQLGTCGDPARAANPLGLRDMMRFLPTWCWNPPLPCLETNAVTHIAIKDHAIVKVTREPLQGGLDPVEQPLTVPTALDPHAPRAIRGGSFFADSYDCCANVRVGSSPDNNGWGQLDDIGFRWRTPFTSPPSLSYLGFRLVCVPCPPAAQTKPLAHSPLPRRGFTLARFGRFASHWLPRGFIALTALLFAWVAWSQATTGTTAITPRQYARYGTFLVRLPKTLSFYEQSDAPARLVGLQPRQWYGAPGQPWEVQIGWNSLTSDLRQHDSLEAAVALLARRLGRDQLQDYEVSFESSAGVVFLCATARASANTMYRCLGYAVNEGEYLWIEVISPTGDVHLDAKGLLLDVVKGTTRIRPR